METEAIITVVVTVAIAASGYAVKYWSDVRLAAREARLARINRQLSEFYGPMYAMAQAGQAAFTALWERSGRDPKAVLHDAPDERFTPIWQSWMTHIFMPLNRRMVSLVVDKADLLDEDEMPESLWMLCAHVYGYEGILRQWETGDDSQLTSAVVFPRQPLRDYVGRRFNELKVEQVRLLGKRARSSKVIAY
jgi:hypothetical protein